MTDLEILKKEFPDYKISQQTTSDPSEFYTLKKGNISIFISYFPEDDVEEDIYLVRIFKRYESNHIGLEFSTLKLAIETIKEEIEYGK